MEGETISTQDEKKSELLDLFFLNVTENLERPLFSINHSSERFPKPTLTALRKYKKYPPSFTHPISHFRFIKFTVQEVYKKIRKSM